MRAINTARLTGTSSSWNGGSPPSLSSVSVTRMDQSKKAHHATVSWPHWIGVVVLNEKPRTVLSAPKADKASRAQNMLKPIFR